MRFQLCHRIVSFILFKVWGYDETQNPGSPEEEDEAPLEMEALTAKVLRQCMNCKSQKNPDVQCPLSATHGDYCSRHYKRPKPFRGGSQNAPCTRSDTLAVKKLQAFWRRKGPFRRFLNQGPAANAIDLATNETELYSFDPVASIPRPYLITFSDERKSIWAFDIRTLVQSMGAGTRQANPYTRDPLSPHILSKVHRRIAWLRARKYQILHVSTETLTPDQLWNQKILDMFLKIEALGYYANCDWFHQMNAYDHSYFYSRLFGLWEWRLGLTAAEKDAIVPGHHALGAGRLFKFPPNEASVHTRLWWQKVNLAVIEAMITRASDEERRKLGAMYVLMALVQASRPAAAALPWVVETVEN